MEKGGEGRGRRKERKKYTCWSSGVCSALAVSAFLFWLLFTLSLLILLLLFLFCPVIGTISCLLFMLFMLFILFVFMLFSILIELVLLLLGPSSCLSGLIICCLLFCWFVFWFCRFCCCGTLNKAWFRFAKLESRAGREKKA